MSQGENPFADDLNPYRATDIEASLTTPEEGGAEAIRRHHIAHEASVKSIGTLYLVGFVLLLLGFMVMIFNIASAAMPPGVLSGMITRATILLVFGVFQGAVGFGLQKLKPWARWTAVVLSAIGLLGFPVGTLISIYFLYLLLTEKSSTVFSPEYQQIIAQTPHVKYKTPMVAWLALGILGLLLVLGAGFLLMSG